MTPHNKRLAANRRVAMDRFAEATTDRPSARASAKRVGCSQSSGRTYLVEIRRGLGVQAI